MEKEYFTKKLEELVKEYNTMVETGERLRNDLKNIEAQTLQKYGAIQEIQRIITEIDQKEASDNNSSKSTK